ncbi:MAG: FkbM family methyltransferase [Aureliella sp.]
MLIDVATHGIFSDALSSQSVVVDLGAHRGDFAVEMWRRFGCSVLAVEPVIDVIANLPPDVAIQTSQVAVTDHDGEIQIWLDDNPQATSILESRKEGREGVVVPCMTLKTLLNKHHVQHVDALKVDIEGAEVGMLDATEDDLLTSIPQISIELHDFNGMITRQESKAIFDRLHGLGFESLRISLTNNENVLFYQRKLIGINSLQEFYARWVSWFFIGWQRRQSRRNAQSSNG